MTYINEIREAMRENGVLEINFLYHYTKPTIQKDGIKYEILSIVIPDDGETTLELTTIPRYDFCLHYLTMDESWRTSSWKHVLDIVETEIKRWNGW